MWPQYFWILYIAETLVLFPLRWQHMMAAKPLPEVLSWLDFCWIANIMCNVMLIFYVIYDFEHASFGFMKFIGSGAVRKILFCAFWGVANGPLLSAVGALGNSLVFHDVDNTVSVFIHLCPSLLTFTFRWKSDQIVSTFPGLFHLDYFDSVDPWRDIYILSVCGYFVWFVPFTLWMCTCGLGMPSNGYDTVFHSMMRGGSPIPRMLGWTKEEENTRAENNDYTVMSVLLYMLLHAVSCCLSMTLSIGCWYSMIFHGCACFLMLLTSIYKGSSRYSYYILENYITILRREFAEVLKPDAASK